MSDADTAFDRAQEHADDSYRTYQETVAKDAPKAEPSTVQVVLNRQQILAAQDIETEFVSVPAWGGGVYVRALTAGQRGQLEAATIDKKGRPDPSQLPQFRATFLALAIVDEKGMPLFTRADVAALMSKSSGAAEEILKVARRLSGMTDEDEEALLGKSETDPFNDSSTGSP